MIGLIDVCRHVSFDDKRSEEFIGKIILNNVDLKDLQSLVSNEKYKEDYLLYNCYFLDESMLDELAILDNQKFNLNLDLYEYFLEATAK